MVPDVSAFAAKHQQATALYHQLKTVREELKTMEATMFQQIPPNTKAIQVSTNNTRMWLKVQCHTRRVPLSEAYLVEQICTCLRLKFAEVQPQELKELSVHMASAIWSQRSTKTESRLVLRELTTKRRRSAR